MQLTEDEARELSQLLFLAREQIAMWGDVVQQRMGVRDTAVDNIRDAVDAFRARYDWNPDGFGSESAINR